MGIQQRSNKRCSGSSGGYRKRIDVGMRLSKRPSWGMAGSSISRWSWGAIRKPFVRVSAIWKRQRMRRRGASAKRGRTPAARRRTADPRSEPPPLVAGVHRWGPDACRRTVDELVVTRIVATAAGAGHTCESPYDPTAAEKIQTGPTHGAEEKDDGPPSRPQRPIRKHRAPAARVRGVRRCSDFDRHEKEGIAGEFSPRRHNLHRRAGGNL